MTLNQYLKQKDPIRMPDVIVKDSEYIAVTSRTLVRNGEVRKRVYFKTENKLLAGIEYCLVGNSFYTVDSDGNLKNRSCFRIAVK